MCGTKRVKETHSLWIIVHVRGSLFLEILHLASRELALSEWMEELNSLSFLLFQIKQSEASAGNMTLRSFIPVFP